ncbi:MAG: hypothetical protein ACTSPM_08470 [Candidatus Heimdallarchaeota archaeon]
MNKTNSLYCPYCGSVQQNARRFCSSCGADINETTETESTGIRIIGERPMNSNDYQRLNASTANAGGYSTGGQTSGTYRAPVYSSTPIRSVSKDNATVALILGIVGIFFSCFIIPLVGLHYVRKAEDRGEDPSTIQIAKVLNWILLILMLVGTIIGFIYIFSFGFLYY